MPTAREELRSRVGVDILKWFLYRVLQEDERYKHGITKCTLTDTAIKKLISYDYPGNYRELLNILRRAVYYSQRREIGDRFIEFDFEYQNEVSDTGDMNTETFIDVASMTMEEVKALCNNYSSKLIKAKAEEILVRNKGSIEKCSMEVKHKNKKAAGQHFKNTYCKPYNLNWKDYR